MDVEVFESHEIDLLKPIPEEYVFSSMHVTPTTRPHFRTVGYVGQWIDPDEIEIRVYVMRGSQLFEYISDIQSLSRGASTREPIGRDNE